MNTTKQVWTAFKVVGARNLQYKRKNGLCYDVQFLIGKNWVRFGRDAINNLQGKNFHEVGQ